MANALDSDANYSPQDRDLADHHQDDDEGPFWERSAKSKGKQREESSAPSEEEEEEATMAYPPGKEDTTESRRIEETLRRWEATERLRRKAARESYTENRSSIVSQVANALWIGTSHSRHRSLGGNHAVLHSRDSMDNLPMDSIAPSPAMSPRGSPPPGSSSPNIIENPFVHPSESLSPFTDSHQVTAIMSPTTAPENAHLGGEASLPERPILKASESSYTKPPPPKPLDLPPPRTPPPIESSPEPVTQPTLHPEDAQRPHTEPETRWWHDWLCGCSEGPDRGGDYQAGRTNPNE